MAEVTPRAVKPHLPVARKPLRVIYLVAIALANVASQYMDKKDYASAEPIFRDVIRRLTEVLPPDNVNTGIARIKLGRRLLRQNRFAEAEAP